MIFSFFDNSSNFVRCNFGYDLILRMVTTLPNSLKRLSSFVGRT